ncbi:MAG: SRPBCC family protein [Deinococcaceae bacterium]
MGINVGKSERTVSGVIGGLLVLAGLRKRGFWGFLLGGIGSALVYRSSTGHCPVYGALDINTAEDTGVGAGEHKSIFVEDAIVIHRSAADLYAFWRNFENLPKIMSHLERVQIIDDQTSRWVAKAPLGTSVEWDAELVYDKPGERIGWRSQAGADVDNAGSVYFEALPDGSTRVNVALSYRPPAGSLGAAVAKLLGEEPSIQIQDDLKRFKQTLESESSKGAQSTAMA